MTSSLAALWADIAAGTAQGHARDSAEAAGFREGQLIAAGIGSGVIRLDGDWAQVLPRLESLGEVKILTRNDAIVHEKIGRFGNVSVSGTTALVLNREVDLRLFLGHWHHAFQVTTASRHGPRTGILFFDLHGDAVHKIYQTEATDRAAWDALVAGLASHDQQPGLEVAPRPLPLAPRADEAIDVAGLRTHWQALKDVHHFHGMLQDFGVDRFQALRLAGPELAREVGADALRRVLETAGAQDMPIMVFVGNPGCIQIHTGAVKRIVEMDGWLNVMDPGFTLHVKSDLLASAWVVRKPTREGDITALELYDHHHRNVAILVGERERGQPERQDWRDLLAALPAAQQARAA